MAKNFKVGDSFQFNGLPPLWWSSVHGFGYSNHPWSKFKTGQILKVQTVDKGNNSYIIDNSTHFYIEQMVPVMLMKLRRKKL